MIVTTVVPALAQLSWEPPKYPRCAAAITPMTSQITTMTPPIPVVRTAPPRAPLPTLMVVDTQLAPCRNGHPGHHPPQDEQVPGHQRGQFPAEPVAVELSPGGEQGQRVHDRQPVALPAGTERVREGERQRRSERAGEPGERRQYLGVPVDV